MIPRVKVELYRWAGSWGPFRITGECIECDFAVAAIREVMSAHPDWPVEFEIKPWLDHIWGALRHGGWHAPVLIIDGRLVTQGHVPTVMEIEFAIQEALNERNIYPPRPPRNPTKQPSCGCRTERNLNPTTVWRTLLALPILLVMAPGGLAQRRQLQEEKIGDGTMVTVLPADAIPAVSQPVFANRQEADKWMDEEEPVLGLVDPVTGQAKAYSLWHLDRHEIVNDKIGGKPIAVTW